MFNIGLKLWSINKNYIDEAIKYFDLGFYQYIELYVVPESYDTYINNWKKLKIPFVLHAPHYKDNMNLANEDNLIVNLKLTEEVKKYADALRTTIIIYHPGTNGNIEETIRQLKIINDNRIVVENKPYYALIKNLICNGATPDELRIIKEQTGLGVCLDFGHAICAANAKKVNPFNFIKDFINLKPKIFHLTDGDYHSFTDKHDHFGKGDFPLLEILKLIPQHSNITNEAVKDSNDNLNDFSEDIKILKGFIEKI